jgi:ubiquinone/menaquinone biosynthesis C-methylase UbiE
VIADRRPKRAPLTLTQRSNLIPITAQVYDAWRVRSLSILTREQFSLEREFALMLDWLGVQAGQHYLDVGTSTGNYARAVAERGASVIAIDISKPMLEKTQERLEGLNLPITLELANVEALPYADSSFDGLTIGASLNEFASTRAALLECARVLKPGGKLFMMYLRRSDTVLGRAFQAGFALSGVRFPDRDAVRQVLSGVGLERQRAEVRRAVTFELFVKTGRGSIPLLSSVGLPRTPGKPQREPLPER